MVIAALIAVRDFLDPRTLIRRRQRRRLTFREEVQLRLDTRPGIDELCEYLRKHAAFEEHCRTQTQRPAPRRARRPPI